MRLFADFQRYNFFCRPGWRWERVCKMCDRVPNPGRCSHRDDELIRKARNFLLRWRERDDPDEREELWFENPGLYYAYVINSKAEDEPEAVSFVQARLLARQPYEQVARVMKTMPDAIRWYEALFFNVVEHLDARDWITKQVLLPAIMRNLGHAHQAQADAGPALPFRDSTVARPFMDASLKLFAYFGGPQLVDVMIAGLQAGRPLISQEDMADWFDQQWTMTVRRRSSQAALQFEINKYNVTELFAIHARIMEIERSADSQEQRKTETERHIKAMVDEIPWALGSRGAQAYEGTTLGDLDKGAAELRDDEVLKVATGAAVPGLKEDWPEALPPPRKEPAALADVEADW